MADNKASLKTFSILLKAFSENMPISEESKKKMKELALDIQKEATIPLKIRAFNAIMKSEGFSHKKSRKCNDKVFSDKDRKEYIVIYDLLGIYKCDYCENTCHINKDIFFDLETKIKENLDRKTFCIVEVLKNGEPILDIEVDHIDSEGKAIVQGTIRHTLIREDQISFRIKKGYVKVGSFRIKKGVFSIISSMENPIRKAIIWTDENSNSRFSCIFEDHKITGKSECNYFGYYDGIITTLVQDAYLVTVNMELDIDAKDTGMFDRDLFSKTCFREAISLINDENKDCHDDIYRYFIEFFGSKRFQCYHSMVHHFALPFPGQVYCEKCENPMITSKKPCEHGFEIPKNGRDICQICDQDIGPSNE